MLLIRWRPSGGRGEYEYIAGAHSDLLGKSIVVKVPRIGSNIATDVRFARKDGKPRLRRDKSNDRTHLNLPPLVAAIAALPQPRREDMGEITLPLTDKGYVVSEIGCEVLEESASEVLLEPVYLRPLHSKAVDIEPRMEILETLAGSQTAIQEWLGKLADGENDASLATSADAVHQILPFNGDTEGDGVVVETGVLEDEEIGAYIGKEGKEKIRIHRYKERDRELARIAKRLFRKRYGSLYCECCYFDFERTYGDLGKNFIEAHHKRPLSTLTEEAETTPSDLAMLCSNCHRMVHRAPDCSVDYVSHALKVQASVI